jgi:hypothetical protein
MAPLLESSLSAGPLAEAVQELCIQGPPGDVWQRESVPEEFLREVVDALTGFLRADLEAGESKTRYVPPES